MPIQQGKLDNESWLSKVGQYQHNQSNYHFQLPRGKGHSRPLPLHEALRFIQELFVLTWKKLWIMRYLLLKSSALANNLWRGFARSIASEPAVHCSDGTEKNGPRWWQQHENQVLIAGIEKQQLELEKLGRWNAEQSSKKKWEEIENFCYSMGISRNAEQCRQRWQRLLTAFFKIKSWENCIPLGKKSFWLMSASDRKKEGLSLNLDRETFHAINVIQSRKELWYSTAGFSSAGEVSSEILSYNANSLESGKDGLERDQQSEITNSEAEQRMEIQQQSETAAFEAQQCSAVHRQPERLDSEQHIEETATSICSDQYMHAFKDNSIADLSGSTQQSHNTHNDARPPVLVQFINQCLVDLEGLEYDPCDPSKAQVDKGKGISHRSSD
ncbi:hypothetical protein GOP47_0030107 [Adiantum capillus-veneris]|nr:hypothetical protein GOP47_0030107 [Adiantum capillus-veneris]